MKLEFSLAFVLLSSTIFAFSQPKYSELKTTASAAKDGSVSINMSVIPIEKHIVNDFQDVPWTLTLKNEKGLSIAKRSYTRKDYSKEKTGFSIDASPTAPKWSFDYKLVAFVCTADKKRCFREVYKGSLDQGALNNSE